MVLGWNGETALFVASSVWAAASEIRAQLAARDSVKGEITLLIGKATAPPPDDTPLDEAVGALERVGVPRMEAIKQVARRRGLPKREVYDQLLNSPRP